MRILQINSVCGIKSTGKICTDLADVLHSKGHECRILYGREKCPEAYTNISKKISSNNEVRLHAFLSRITDKSGFYSKKSAENIINEIELYDPDIIHLHNIHGYYVNIEDLFSYLKKSNRKVVWTLHDCWAFTGHCSHFSAINCDKWIDGCSKCPQKKQYPTSVVCDNSEKNYLRKKLIFTEVKELQLVTPSKWLSNVTKKSFLKNYPIDVIPNGVDLVSFKPNKTNPYDSIGLKGKKILLGVATAWSDRKGLYDFIKLSELLSKEYQIVLLGVTEQQLNLLPRQVIGITATNSREELAQYYTNAFAVLSLSSEETMGLTIVEALACGTPVVVYNATALPELVTPEVGRIVEFGQVEKIVDVLDDLALIDSQACITRASDYEKQKMYEKYIVLYERILK